MLFRSAAAKQAYWDAQGNLPDEEAKIVPDLPTNAVPAMAAEEEKNTLPMKIAIAVGVVVLLGAAAFLLL